MEEAINTLVAKGMTTQQATVVVTNHLTPGQPNSPDLSPAPIVNQTGQAPA